MNIIKPLSLFSAIIFSASAAAAVTLEVPDSVDLLVVNGAKPDTSGNIFSSSKKVEMEDGQQQIVFRYHPYFSQGNDRVGVESEVVIAKFNAAGQALTFNLPQYRNANDAEREIKNMQWALHDSQGNSVEMHQDRLRKDGMQIGRDYRQETRDYNQNGGPAAITVHYVKPSSANGQPVDTTAEEMLHFWYGKADASTKARFKAYVNQQ